MADVKKQVLMDQWVHVNKMSDPPTEIKQGQTEIRMEKSGFVSKLWETASKEARQQLPEEIKNKMEDPSQALFQVEREAYLRQAEEDRTARKVQIPGKDGKEIKLRDIFGGIAKAAKKFRDVGDWAAKADISGHLALPWLAIRLCLSAGIAEHEMYGLLIQGNEMCASLVTHYVVIERIYVGQESNLVRQVRNNLLSLYSAIMNFLVKALEYFPPVQQHVEEDIWDKLGRKTKRAGKRALRIFKAMDPNAQITIKDLLSNISTEKGNVDASTNHADQATNRRMLAGLGSNQELIMRQLEAAGVTEEERYRRLDVIMDELQTPIRSMDIRIEAIYGEMEHNRMHNQRARIYDWISPLAHESRRVAFHEIVSRQRLSGTGEWLFSDTEYLHWQDAKESTIAWVCGATGSGKSSLLSLVICRVQNQIKASERSERLAYFFFGIAESSSILTPDDAMRDILRQLATAGNGSEIDDSIRQKFEDASAQSEQPVRPSMPLCIDLIVALSGRHPITIVIDGLEEVPDTFRQGQTSRGDLIDGLSEIIERAGNSVKVMLSTVPNSLTESKLFKTFGGPLPEEPLHSGNRHVIEVDKDKNDHDLGRFIKKLLEERISRRELLNGQVDNDLQNKIKHCLKEQSAGKFRYASLQMARLCDDRMDKATVEDELDKPLPDVADLYDRSIDEIKHERYDRIRTMAQNALQFLRCAQEPLSKLAFLEAVSVDGSTRPEESHVRSACRTLVEAGHGNGHFNFADRFVDERLARLPEYSDSECHLMAAVRCLTMMNTASSAIGRLSNAQSAFWWYAKHYWPLHYQKIKFGEEPEDTSLLEARQKRLKQVQTQLQKFIMQGNKTSQAFDTWIKDVPSFVKTLGENNILSKQLRSLQASSGNALHIICVFGFADLVKSNSRYFDWNQRNAHGQTALCLAVENNRIDTVKALLKTHHIDVNEFNEKAVWQLVCEDLTPVTCYASALQAAAVLGSTQMIETLTDQKARTSLSAGYYGSPLQAACLAGHDAIVELFLNTYDLDPNTQGGFHGNPLQAAAAKGHLSIVKTLLEAGACETTEGGHFGTALMAAVCAGNGDVVEALFDHTTDRKAMANSRSDRFGTPLQKAIEMDNIDLVGKLIINEANVNTLAGARAAQNMPAGSDSALAIAAWGGHKKLVAMLRNQGADADLTHVENQHHLLHQTAQQDMLELVQYCIEGGCDVNMTTDHGPEYNGVKYRKTPLSLACAEGHLRIVQLLLDKGARIQYPGDHAPNLTLAASRGHVGIVEALIQEHKKRWHNDQATKDFINRRVEARSATALMEAIRFGTFEVVEALLKNGAALTRKGQRIGPLHEAAWLGRPRIVSALLSHLRKLPEKDFQAEVDARNEWEKTPTMDAAERNHVHIFDILLRNEADPFVRDKWGNTLCHYAAWRNHTDILKLLLLRVGDEDQATVQEWLMTKNAPGNTVLQEAIHQKAFPCVKMLLNAGAKLTPSQRADYLRRFAGGTPLDDFRKDVECFDGHPEDLRLYLNHRNGTDGYSMLHDAARHGRFDVCEFLLAQPATDATTLEAEWMFDTKKINTATALHGAAWEGRPRQAAALLRRAREQCDEAQLARFINYSNDFGGTALMDAAHKNQPDILHMLLVDYHADFTLVENHGHNALHYCAFRGHTTCVHILLEYAAGASTGDPMAASSMGRRRLETLLNQESVSHKRPLHDSVGQGHTDVVKLILAHGPDYEVYTDWSDSPLHRAIQEGRHEILRLLLEHMARDPDREKFKRVLVHRNNSGKRIAIEAAKVRGQKENVELLRKYMLEVDAIPDIKEYMKSI